MRKTRAQKGGKNYGKEASKVTSQRKEQQKNKNAQA